MSRQRRRPGLRTAFPRAAASEHGSPTIGRMAYERGYDVARRALLVADLIGVLVCLAIVVWGFSARRPFPVGWILLCLGIAVLLGNVVFAAGWRRGLSYERPPEIVRTLRILGGFMLVALVLYCASFGGPAGSPDAAMPGCPYRLTTRATERCVDQAEYLAAGVSEQRQVAAMAAFMFLHGMRLLVRRSPKASYALAEPL